MAKRRPPGSKKRGPTPRPSPTSRQLPAALQRMMGAQTVCYVHEDHAYEAADAIRRWLDQTTFRPPLGEFSLFVHEPDETGTVELAAYGLEEGHIGAIADWIEKDSGHHAEWSVWFPWDHPDYVPTDG